MHVTCKRRWVERLKRSVVQLGSAYVRLLKSVVLYIGNTKMRGNVIKNQSPRHVHHERCRGIPADAEGIPKIVEKNENQRHRERNHRSDPTASTTYSTCCGLTNNPLDSAFETSDAAGETLLNRFALSTVSWSPSLFR